MPEISIDTTYAMIVLQDLKPVFVNENYAHLYGYTSAAELIASIDSFLDLIDPTNHQQAKENYYLTIQGQITPRGRTFKNRDRFGRPITVFAIDHVIDWEGEPALQVTVIDLSAQARAQSQLRDNERKFKQLITSSGQGIMVHRNFIPVFVNQAWVDIMRAPSIDYVLEHVHLFSLLTPAEKEAAKARLQAVLTGQLSGSTVIVKNRCFDGETRYFRIYDNLIEWEQEPAIQSVIEDVTDRVLLENKLTNLSVTDPLTNVYNRRELDRVLSQEHKRWKRYRQPFALILLDLDHFKSINDTWGHDVGDVILQSVAQTLQKRIRQTDVLGRWGGEEFLIICPSTGSDGAQHLAEGLLAAVRETTIQEGLYLTASIGVASVNSLNVSSSDVLKHADLSMYHAKRSGRNRVCLFKGNKEL